MKRLFVLILTVIMFSFGGSYGESGIDLSSLSPDELLQLISSAEIQHQLSYETLLKSATQVLTEYWKNEVYADPFYEGSNGYLEILSAQVTFIKKDFATQVEYSSSSDAMFENVYCVVDFVLLSDYFRTAPYYMDVGIDNCVVIYRDGTMAVRSQSIFNTYRVRTFNNDFSAMIEKVDRFDVGDNNVYYLVSK